MLESNVVFISTSYRPDYLEIIRLRKLQDNLKFFKISLVQKSRHLNVFQKQLVLDRFHHGLRYKMREVILGDRD